LTNIILIEEASRCTLSASQRVVAGKTIAAARQANSVLGKVGRTTFVAVIVIVRVGCAADTITIKY